MNKWDVSYMPSQEGRIVIVTGANSGIGYYTSKGLAMKGAHVVMACRSRDKAKQAAALIKKDIPEAKLTVMDLDLSDLSSIKRFAESFMNSFDKLDILINNAGLMAIPYRKTRDGFEMQFAVNHLGHFALTGRLFKLMRSTPGSRIVVLASSAEKMGKIDLTDLNREKRYRSWQAYFGSKLANMLFMLHLSQKLGLETYDMIAVAAHPGYSASNILEKGPAMKGRNWLVKAGHLANRIAAQSAEMGALPTLYAATEEHIENGSYYGPGGFLGMRGYPARTSPRSKRITAKLMSELWKQSEVLTGVSFLSD